ncbi:MAG TPA: hypothetical protein VFC16_03445 [Nakamurella sp.]|nr:hypothetical protein [Nakamurella sp.]
MAIPDMLFTVVATVAFRGFGARIASWPELRLPAFLGAGPVGRRDHPRRPARVT